MEQLRLEGINQIVSKRIAPFLEELLKEYGERVHSIHLVGSAVSHDFHEKHSNINSVIVLHEIDLGFLRFLGSLGKRYRKSGISAPLVITPLFIRDSLDVFPMEFLDLRTLHGTVYGEDVLRDLPIERSQLRLQCEREIKTRLIGLRQGYVASLGEKEPLVQLLSQSITGCMPLFRGIIFLLGQAPPAKRQDVLKVLRDVTTEHCASSGVCIETGTFEKILSLKHREFDPSKEGLHTIFESYYRAIEIIDRLINELPS